MLPNYLQINFVNNFRNNSAQDDFTGSDTAGPMTLQYWEVGQLLSRFVEDFVIAVEAEGVALLGIKATLGRNRKLHAQFI